jgi:hypothetical protein
MLLGAALGLAQRGMAIFPCRARGKEPATYHGVLDATKDHNTIRGWWGADPHFNIGLATGTPSGVFAIDIDGIDAEGELHKLEAENGLLPPTVASITGRGRHVLFQMPSGVKIANSAGQVAPGIDVRGTGGYIVAPPSVHPSGRPYAWSVDSGTAFAPAPAWLIHKISTPARRALFTGTDWYAIARNGAGEGQRNATVTRLAGYLLRHIDAGVTLEFIQAWNATHCTPPLESDEVYTIVNSIAGRELRKRG